MDISSRSRIKLTVLSTNRRSSKVIAKSLTPTAVAARADHVAWTQGDNLVATYGTALDLRDQARFVALDGDAVY